MYTQLLQVNRKSDDGITAAVKTRTGNSENLRPRGDCDKRKVNAHQRCDRIMLSPHVHTLAVKPVGLRST